MEDDMYEDESSACCGEKRERKGVCWWSPLFVVDYVTCVVLLVAALLLKLLVNPHHMYVPTVNITTALVDSEGNVANVVQTIDIAQDRQYPAVPETLPVGLAGAVCGLTALAAFVLAQLAVRPCAARRWDVAHDFHNCALGVVESLALLLCVADVLKPFAGRYRPRYLEIAAAAAAASDERAEWEGRVSYPSGHSGTAFATMFFATLYLLGKFRVFSRGARHGGGAAGRFALVTVAALPTLGAFLVAITRTRDYMHNFSDINAGALIGALCALAAYFTVYPALTDPQCQCPRLRAAPHAHARAARDRASDGALSLSDEEALREVVVEGDADAGAGAGAGAGAQAMPAVAQDAGTKKKKRGSSKRE